MQSNRKTTKQETQQNKPKTKQAKEQQLKQNKEVIAGDTGPYSTNETPTQEPPDLPWTRRETNWHCQWPSKQCEKSVQLPIKEAN